jgi:hypothetical protein
VAHISKGGRIAIDETHNKGMTFTGDRVFDETGEVKNKGTFKLDVTKKPKAIEISLHLMICAVGGVCRGGEHSTAAAAEWLFNSELYSVRAEVLAWLESVGGTCDCTIQSKALPAVLRLSQELWE